MKLTYACPCVLAAACAAQPASITTTTAPGSDMSFVHLELTTTSSLTKAASPAQSLSTQAPPQMSFWVDIAKIELASQAGDWITLSTEPTRFDALAFAGGAMVWLAGADVPAGVYRDLRLTFDGATFVVGTTEQPLDMASGVSLIPLDNALGRAGGYDVVLGLDLANSVWLDTNGYAMAPHVDLDAMVAE